MSGHWSVGDGLCWVSMDAVGAAGKDRTNVTGRTALAVLERLH